MRPNLVWFRRDLRLTDNPALIAAAQCGRPVIPLYIFDKRQNSPYAMNGTAAAWNLMNAGELDRQLQLRYGSRLVLRSGDPEQEILAMAQQVSAGAIYCNAICEPDADAADGRISSAAGQAGLEFHQFPGNRLLQPGSIRKADGSAYRVFTPFYRQFIRQYRHAPPQPEPQRLLPPADWPVSLVTSQLLEFISMEHRTAADQWAPGAQAAADSLTWFASARLATYAVDRDRLDIPATSAISPYLQGGAISIRQVWDTIERAIDHTNEAQTESARAFQRQLVWREFCYEILAEYPQLPAKPYREEFAAFPWQPSAELLTRWQAGQTGYPVVDAAMRQLAVEGWMPGRARMVVASFLIKHLLQDWRQGEQCFRQRLVDADLACNAFNWQWVAGCGFDAAPYFRIFNPITQGQKFDPAGNYVRLHVPELSELPAKYIHSPWTAPGSVLRAAGMELDQGYPGPVVDHGRARQRALAAFRRLKTG